MQADKKLFTPGPLTTSYSVKQAMLKDLGSRDDQFIQVIKYVQAKLIEIAGLFLFNFKNCKIFILIIFEGLSSDEYTVVLMQGSGTFGVESVFQTSTKLNESNVLILENGAYGQRIEKICKLLSINHKVLRFPEDRAIDCEVVKSFLETENKFTHVVSSFFIIFHNDKNFS